MSADVVPGGRVGLCEGCAHARRVPTRHALYWRCTLAETDARFERYPRLPVLACTGYAPSVSEGDSTRRGDPA